MADAPELTAEQYAQIVAGDRCGCGHHVRSHLPPAPNDIEGAKCGPCKVKKCDCKGLIDCTDDQERDYYG